MLIAAVVQVFRVTVASAAPRRSWNSLSGLEWWVNAAFALLLSPFYVCAASQPHPLYRARARTYYVRILIQSCVPCVEDHFLSRLCACTCGGGHHM